MEDVSFAKFRICKGKFKKVRKVLKSESNSSSVNAGGIECLLFDDKSSVFIPVAEKKSINIITVKYSGRNYPSYLSNLSGYLNRMNSFYSKQHY